MALTASSIQAGFEPIPGYILREKLGAGGYGEVWLADAPGGLKKAIKFVHGNIDGNRACSELKSLQRVRQVNHPFILSLERIEVVDGQLIIVTELAQGSLHDRFLEFHQKGFVGIMRERLIGYMRDTAEGLDFLCQQHDLQHLDVKPANLLLVADRVKIADFGLIKDIQSNSLSVMGGLTPTYAAPEMFDGRPGRSSDQYSLAIVYQELLTGTLPFRGRTTAQLANEHLNKAPNLEAIPLLERPVLAKALSKRPQLRFSDCREFIAALERVHAQGAQPAPSERQDAPQIKKRPAAGLQRPSKFQQSNPLSKAQLSSVSTQSQIAPSQFARAIDVLPSLADFNSPTDDATAESTAKPEVKKSFTIGLGATGAHAVMGMRREILETTPQQLESEKIGFLVIDSDQKTIESVLDLDRTERLPYHCSLLIPLKSPQYYREHTKSDFRQLSRRWLYNIPRSLKTEGVRPLGMLSFLDNAGRIYDAIQASLVEIAKSSGDANAHEPIEVRIVSSAHGGTGSAIVSEIGFIVRQLAADFEIPIQVELILTCASPTGFASSDLTTASALACLMEINHYFQTEGLHPQIDQIPESTANNQPPFDRVSMIYGGQCGNSRDWEDATNQASHYLWACACSELGPRLALTRLEAKQNEKLHADQGWTTWLSTVNSRHIEITNRIDPTEAANRLALQKCLQWISALNEGISEKPAGKRTSSDPKLLEKMDFFVGDMFRSNHWTAQAWVRECMNCLLVSSDPTPPQAENVEPSEQIVPAPNTTSLNVEQQRDLEHVCEQLAMDVQNAMQTMSLMVTNTQQKLAEWLISRWLTSPVELSHLRDLVRLIGSKFTVNANSLEVVSQKLCENHDAILERMYSGELKSSQEQDQQLQTMALEARFHSLGAKMLARLAEHMSYLEDLWVNECILLKADLSTWAESLAKVLGICLDNSSKSNSLLSALLQTECEDSINKEVRRLFQSLVGSRLMNTVALSDTKPTPPEDKQQVFALILTETIRLFSSSSKSSTKETRDVAEQSTSLSSVAVNSVSASSLSEVTQTISVLEPTQSISLKTGTSDAKTADSVALVKRSLEMDIDSSRPYFVEFGGAVRNVALLPSQLAQQLDPLQLATLKDRQVATIAGDQIRQTSLVCLGEHLVLSDIMDRVWMPSSDIWHLAHRILSRVDVDWVPMNVANN